jgi:hypothetical protein
MTSELKEVREALELSASTFKRYAEYHKVKNTEDGSNKAQANAQIYMQVADALTKLDSYIERLNSDEFVKEVELLPICPKCEAYARIGLDLIAIGDKDSD